MDPHTFGPFPPYFFVNVIWLNLLVSCKALSEGLPKGSGRAKDEDCSRFLRIHIDLRCLWPGPGIGHGPRAVETPGMFTPEIRSFPSFVSHRTLLGLGM